MPANFLNAENFNSKTLVNNNLMISCRWRGILWLVTSFMLFHSFHVLSLWSKYERYSFGHTLIMNSYFGQLSFCMACCSMSREVIDQRWRERFDCCRGCKEGRRKAGDGERSIVDTCGAARGPRAVLGGPWRQRYVTGQWVTALCVTSPTCGFPSLPLVACPTHGSPSPGHKSLRNSNPRPKSAWDLKIFTPEN